MSIDVPTNSVVTRKPKRRGKPAIKLWRGPWTDVSSATLLIELKQLNSNHYHGIFSIFIKSSFQFFYLVCAVFFYYQYINL